MKMKIIRHRCDIILIASLLFVSLASVLALFLLREEGKSIKVEVDGKTVAIYSLDVDGEYILNGGTNTLTIKDGKAYIRDATCPDKTCVKTGRISLVGECAVCLPNRVYVSVIGDHTDGVDLVS